MSRILGLNIQQERALRQELSYTAGNYYSKGFGPRKKTLLGKRGDFPTGLLDRVYAFLLKNSIVYEEKIFRKRPKSKESYKLNIDFKPHEFQIAAADKAIFFGRGIISSCTGSGKSLIIALIAARLNLKTLVVVPTLELKKQLSETLIGCLKRNHEVIIENIDSPALRTMRDFDVLIIDEAHHVAARTYQKLNKTAWTGIYYRFFLTATPFRNNTEETLLFESIAGRLIYKLDYKDAVSLNIIVPIESYYIEVPKQQTDVYTWAEVYSALVVNNEIRNKIIADSLLRINSSNISCLCLVKEIAHGRILADLTGLSFVSGEDEESRKLISDFSLGKTQCLIATEGIMGEGVDSKPCEYVLIAGLGKAKSAFMQKCGRAVRKYPGKESAKIILFKDSSHKFTLRHFKEQVKIMKQEYNTVPLKLEIK